MYKIILHKIAEEVLESVLKNDKKSFNLLYKALDDLEENGVQATNTKHLSNTDKIFRKRVGRWRILFTEEKDVLHVWIIAVEKDTRKDYQKWIRYISYQV